MKRIEPHDFYLLKLKKNLDPKKWKRIGLDVLDKVETDQYKCIAHCWIPDDLMECMAPSFSELSLKVDYYGINLIAKKEDAKKIQKVCEKWIKIFQNADEYVELSDWKEKYLKSDLICLLRELEDMSKELVQKEDRIICYCGI